jgi:hypothetical protein
MLVYDSLACPDAGGGNHSCWGIYIDNKYRYWVEYEQGAPPTDCGVDCGPSFFSNIDAWGLCPCYGAGSDKEFWCDPSNNQKFLDQPCGTGGSGGYNVRIVWIEKWVWGC